MGVDGVAGDADDLSPDLAEFLYTITVEKLRALSYVRKEHNMFDASTIVKVNNKGSSITNVEQCNLYSFFFIFSISKR